MTVTSNPCTIWGTAVSYNVFFKWTKSAFTQSSKHAATVYAYLQLTKTLQLFTSNPNTLCSACTVMYMYEKFKNWNK